MKKLITLLTITFLFCFENAFPQTYYSTYQAPHVSATAPLEMNYGYSRHAGFYNKNLMVRSGTITGMAWGVVASATGTFPVKIYLENVSYNNFGGTSDWGTYTSGATLVYDGNLGLNAGGWAGVTFDTPFTYNINNNIVVYIEFNYGGTGPTNVATFACKEIDSSTDWYSLQWTSNNTPPTNNGLLIDYLPHVMFLFESLSVAAPTSPGSTPGCGFNTISWTNSAANDTIMIAYNFSGNFGTPMNGSHYTVGSVISLTLNDSVIFVGKASEFTHNGISQGQNYKYRLWHKNEYREYSNHLFTSVTAASNTPKFYDFDSGTGLPIGWIGNMSSEPDHGYEFQGLTFALSGALDAYVTTTNFCNIYSDTYLEFKYRLVDVNLYPANATSPGDLENIVVSVSTDNGSTWTPIHTINSADHVETTDFATVTLPLGVWEDEMIKIKILCSHNSGNFYFDLDNINIYNLTAISENTIEKLFVYPNPTTESIIIDLKNFTNEKVKISIFDINGTEISTGIYTNTTETIDVNGLPSGLYFIKAVSDKTNSSAVFVKQ